MNQQATLRGVTDEERAQVEAHWIGRCKSFGFPEVKARPSKAYLVAQAHFFAGAMSALHAQHPCWIIGIMRGDDLRERGVSR